MGFRSLAQRQPQCDGEDVFAVADVISKLADFGRIGLGEYAVDPNMRVFRPGLFREHRGESERATVSDFRQELHGGLVTDGVGYGIERIELRDRCIIVNRNNTGHAERLCFGQLLPRTPAMTLAPSFLAQ